MKWQSLYHVAYVSYTHNTHDLVYIQLCDEDGSRGSIGATSSENGEWRMGITRELAYGKNLCSVHTF